MIGACGRQQALAADLQLPLKSFVSAKVSRAYSCYYVGSCKFLAKVQIFEIIGGLCCLQAAVGLTSFFCVERYADVVVFVPPHGAAF